MESLYRRPLSAPLVSFASPDGRVLFHEALAAGTMERYFALAEQHHTQADPAFCGLASLVVALNTLLIDPGRLWKGPWRWFSEDLLDCCVPLEQVRQAGLTIDELACLANCNGASAVVRRAADSTEAEFRDLLDASSRSAETIVIAGYSRTELGQTGAGHFSPLAGYHRERDVALILDVARFKYPPHWAPVDILFRAMQGIDSATGKSRGWIELERAPAPRNLGFVFTNQSGGWQRITQLVFGGARAALLRARPQNVAAAVRVLLEQASDAAAGIALRETSDPQHQQLVEQVLVELRATTLYQLVRAAEVELIAEFGTALLLLLPRDTWGAVDRALAEELTRLCDVAQLAQPLRGDLVTLRAQLDTLMACRGPGPQ